MRRPGLIVCDISGYGADGPYRDKKAKNLLIQSEAGLLSVTGTPEVPGKAGASIAAGMYAYTNILAALMHRQRTGRGQRIDPRWPPKFPRLWPPQTPPPELIGDRG